MSTTPAVPVSAPLRYEPAFEHPGPHEAETQKTIDEQMHKIQEKTYADGGRAIRSVHAKSHGLLLGELEVLPGLPAAYAQGIAVTSAGGRLPVVMRLSTVPGDILPDDVSTPRGLSVKIIGVQGERLPGTEGDVTQDFVMVNGPAFQNKDASKFAANLKLLAATTDKAEGTKQVLSAALRGLEKVVEAVGGKSATLMALGGHPETHPLGETYYTQVPVLWGAYFGKVCVRPVSEELKALFKAPVDLKDKPDGLRDAVSGYFSTRGGVWELCVQLCTDIEKMPIEDASVVWDEKLSPYVPVARLYAHPQPSYDHARATAIDEGLAFSPWHGIAAHRPLGSVMRLRRQAYANAQRFRAAKNQVVLSEPKTIGDVGI